MIVLWGIFPEYAFQTQIFFHKIFLDRRIPVEVKQIHSYTILENAMEQI